MVIKANINVENEMKMVVNNEITKEVSRIIKNFNIEAHINKLFTDKINKDINKYVTSGKFLELTAKAVAKTIDADKIISIIDMNEFKKELAKNLSNAILNKI
jgi:hypothetical protein